jgi:hypothetical protein
LAGAWAIAATTGSTSNWDGIFDLGRIGSTAHGPCFYHEENVISEVPMAEPTYEELKARLQDLEKQVETKKRSGTMEFKVSEKGGVSVYGLGRFPVTLYYEQWTRLLDAAENLRLFLEENKPKLKLKGQ